MNLFDRQFLDENGEPLSYINKCEPEFFERITGILPMHVPMLEGENLLQTLEVLVKRDLGSDRLFLHYLYLRIERRVCLFNEDQYCRLIRTLADKGYQEDSEFWQGYVFKYLYEKHKPKGEPREFTSEKARKIWDSIVFLKIKCPQIEVTEVLRHLERFMDDAKVTTKIAAQ